MALRRARLLLRIAAVVGALTALLGVAFEATETAGLSFWKALNGSTLGHVLSTRFGIVWLAAAVLWILALVLTPVVLAGPAAATRARLIGLAVPLSVLVALPAFAGHASVEHPVWLFLASNVIHVTSMTLWVGGLVALVFLVPAATRKVAGSGRTRLLARSVGRFSPLALACVCALLATGIVQSLVEINAWAELTHTAYGRAVLIKIVLLAVLIGLGALNRQRSVPRLKARAARGAAAGTAGVDLRRALQAEVSLVAGVIVVSGALSAYTPAKDAYMPMRSVTATLGPTKVQLTLMPARVGANELDLYLGNAKHTDAMSGSMDAGKAMDKMTVNATLPSKGIGPIPMEAMKAGPGHYMIDTATLGAPGSWVFDVVHQVSDFDEYEQRLQIDVH